MRRTRYHRRNRPDRDADLLVVCATRLAESGSRMEDAYWEDRLAACVTGLLEEENNESVNVALDLLWGEDPRAYDELADMIEACCEGSRIEVGGTGYDVLMIVAPVLAWSRFEIPAGKLPAEVVANLQVQLGAHVLARDARLALADMLFSPDHLPPGYSETRALANALWNAAAAGRKPHFDPTEFPAAQRFISDARYIIGAVAVPRGAPIFRWQEKDGAECTREQALEQWCKQAEPCLAPVLPACAFDLLLPDAYHAAWRVAERDGRTFSVRAAVAYLEVTLSSLPAELRAVVAPFYGKHLEEYRIGFTLRDSPDVVHGVVWPLLGSEDENSDLAEQIEATLNEAGVREVLQFKQRFPLEYCDDCGAPVFANPNGEPVHAELPETVSHQPTHLH